MVSPYVFVARERRATKRMTSMADVVGAFFD